MFLADSTADFSQIKECACIPIDDPKKILGQRPTAFVVRKPETDLNLTDLKKYLYSKLDSYKIPFTIIEIDSLPRNQIGKVDRKELSRQWYEIYLPKNTFKSTN
jgi:non-ribosomal peptide synthetase component E (peptide arylation enzyme)